MAINTKVIVPAEGSKSAMVRGIRSPRWSAITITKWPALALAATWEASTRISWMPGTSSDFCRIRVIWDQGSGEAGETEGCVTSIPGGRQKQTASNH